MNLMTVLLAAVNDSMAVGTAVEPHIEETSYFKLVFAVNSLWIIIPLILMLAFAIYFFVKKWLVVTRASQEDGNFMNNIRDFIHDGKLDSAVALCRSTNNPTARMIDKGLSRLGRPLDDIRTAIENEGNLEVARLEKGVSALATIAAVAPMMGFLGTVVGMVQAFDDIEVAGDISPTVVAGGMKVALLTTIFGLIVAIILQIFYNYILTKIESLVAQMEDGSISFMDILVKNKK